MLQELKWFNTYGVDPKKAKQAKHLIQQGNDTSLSIVLICEFLVLIIFHVLSFVMDLPLEKAKYFMIVEAIIAVIYFLVRTKSKFNNYIFYYASVEVMLLFAVYIMRLNTFAGAALYPAITVVFPLFYMHTMIGTMVFYWGNMFAFIIVARFGPEQFQYLNNYLLTVILFSVMGVGIHYLFQSNRMRELLNLKENQEQKVQLTIASTFDQLSKVLMRKVFIKQFEQYMQHRKTGDCYAIAILDVDKFKNINDTYGHQVGDRAIEAVGECIRNVLGVTLCLPVGENFELDRDKDYGNLVGRLGGDEFIMLITSEENEEDVLKKVNELIGELNKTSVGPISSISASIGIRTCIDVMSYDELYTQADMALYAAKEAGRNVAVTYTFNMENVNKEIFSDTLDELTGLLDEKSFKKNAAEILLKNPDEEYTVLHFDIDNFKTFNAKYGFSRGDKFLKDLADAIKSVYPTQLLSRFSDDHFVVMTEKQVFEDSIFTGREVLRDMSNDYKNVIRLGIYVMKDGREDINRACDNAKLACDNIRGRYYDAIKYYDNDLERNRERHQDIIDSIDDAIANDWIKVFYQPVVDAKTKKCVGFEALSRWNDPTVGMLPPFEFIETLEKAHLIYKLDLYVVEQACKDIISFREKGYKVVPVSINLSRKDFEAIDIMSAIDDIIDKYNISHDLIDIEITESALMDDEQRIKNIVEDFHDRKYSVWMDDFGSGYSSLNTLKSYDFDVVKLDMVFIKDVSEKSKIVLRSIIDMIRELNVKSLCEGVETEEQFELLKELGCDYCQGYLFSRPLPKEEVLKLDIW